MYIIIDISFIKNASAKYSGGKWGKDAGKMKSVRDAKSVRTKGIVAITGNIIVVIVMRKIVIAMNAIIIIKDVGVTDVIFSGI